MKTIAFYSTNNKSERANFETALMNGLASHYGLYMMKRNDIPRLSPETLKAMKGKSYARIAFEVLNPFLGAEVAEKELQAMLADAYDDGIIPTIMQHLTGRTHIMWLTQGPTYSFKDYAARFFGRMLNYFLKRSGLKRVVAVATSGDTGGPSPMPFMAWTAWTTSCFSPKDPSPNGSDGR